MISFELLKNHIAQIPGPRIKGKYIAIESDDWGSLRVGTRIALKTLDKHGLFIDDPFVQLDTIASQRDLEYLFEVLTSIKDSTGNHPVITANTNVANPNFEKIRSSDFNYYYYELFTETIKRLGDRGDPFRLWQEGFKKGFFIPQYHGREHLNVHSWMNALKANHKETRLAFDCGVYGLITNTPFSKKNHYMAAYDFFHINETFLHEAIIRDGFNIFKKIFGYKPISFISPQYIWHFNHEATLQKLDINLIQGQRKQIIPTEGIMNYQTKFRYIGQKNKHGQIYNVRNCTFEPFLCNRDWINTCLRDIEIAFKWGKPAVISSHRINYCGSMSQRNRDNNLIQLKQLLNKIIVKWPDVQFISSDKLLNFYFPFK